MIGELHAQLIPWLLLPHVYSPSFRSRFLHHHPFYPTAWASPRGARQHLRQDELHYTPLHHLQQGLPQCWSRCSQLRHHSLPLLHFEALQRHHPLPHYQRYECQPPLSLIHHFSFSQYLKIDEDLPSLGPAMLHPNVWRMGGNTTPGAQTVTTPAATNPAWQGFSFAHFPVFSINERAAFPALSTFSDMFSAMDIDFFAGLSLSPMVAGAGF